jgi:hypothetical protein
VKLARTLRCGSRTLASQNGLPHSIFFIIVKTLWVFFPHVFFILSCIFFRTVVGTLNVYHPYGFVPNHFDFPVQDVYWLHPEISFVLHLDHILINFVVRVSHIFL